MTLVVVASNFLVQFPVNVTVAGINLADLLTWGAFTYPVAFPDHRPHQPPVRPEGRAQGGICGLRGRRHALLLHLRSAHRDRIRLGIPGRAAARYRGVQQASPAQVWWRAPLVGSLLGSMLDTVIFFSFAFAAFFVFFGANDPFALEASPVLGVFTAEAPRWISWAMGDFWVKLIVGLVMLLPYGALMSVIKPMPGAKANA
jgi:uncharacterized PurR-regulated membrane protein YhhQ (DUF165 family)